MSPSHLKTLRTPRPDASRPACPVAFAAENCSFLQSRFQQTPSPQPLNPEMSKNTRGMGYLQPGFARRSLPCCPGPHTCTSQTPSAHILTSLFAVHPRVYIPCSEPVAPRAHRRRDPGEDLPRGKSQTAEGFTSSLLYAISPRSFPINSNLYSHFRTLCEKHGGGGLNANLRRKLESNPSAPCLYSLDIVYNPPPLPWQGPATCGAR